MIEIMPRYLNDDTSLTGLNLANFFQLSNWQNHCFVEIMINNLM